MILLTLHLALGFITSVSVFHIYFLEHWYFFRCNIQTHFPSIFIRLLDAVHSREQRSKGVRSGVLLEQKCLCTPYSDKRLCSSSRSCSYDGLAIVSYQPSQEELRAISGRSLDKTTTSHTVHPIPLAEAWDSNHSYQRRTPINVSRSEARTWVYWVTCRDANR